MRSPDWASNRTSSTPTVERLGLAETVIGFGPVRSERAQYEHIAIYYSLLVGYHQNGKQFNLSIPASKLNGPSWRRHGPINNAWKSAPQWCFPAHRVRSKVAPGQKREPNEIAGKLIMIAQRTRGD